MFARFRDHHSLPREQIDAWQRRGEFDFVHYGYGETRQLWRRILWEPAEGQTPLVHCSRNSLWVAFQGTRDSLVHSKDVKGFAATCPNVTLSLLDDDHQLVASLPQIWNDVAPFLGSDDETRSRRGAEGAEKKTIFGSAPSASPRLCSCLHRSPRLLPS